MSPMHSRRPLALLTLAGLAAACTSDGAGPTPGAQVTFHVAVAAQSPGLGAIRSGDTVATATDTLVFEQVELVLRDIRFKRTDDDACPDDDHDGDDDDSVAVAFRHGDGDDDSCEYYEAGPFLLDLPLHTGVTRAFSVAVDTGTYDELRLKLHKPEDDDGDPRDSEFLAQHPDFRKISIRASGTFNGAPFTFETDLNAHQRMDLVPPLVVSGGLTNVDVTIQVDLSGWFVDGAGGLVDPATASKGGPNDHLVRDNIRDSFRAFRDDDRDGHDDDGDDDADDDNNGGEDGDD